MRRRRTLAALGTALVGVLTGCQSSRNDTTSTTTPRSTTTSTATPTPTTTTTSTTTPPGPRERTRLYVHPTGAQDATGAKSDPLHSFQAAFEYARPGDTIHALPGDYVEAVRTRRSGTPDAPITLTGPRDAVFRGNPQPERHKFGLHIEHPHIHVRGMTFNGLHDPTHPDRATSYVNPCFPG